MKQNTKHFCDMYKLPRLTLDFPQLDHACEAVDDFLQHTELKEATFPNLSAEYGSYDGEYLP